MNSETKRVSITSLKISQEIKKESQSSDSIQLGDIESPRHLSFREKQNLPSPPSIENQRLLKESNEDKLFSKEEFLYPPESLNSLKKDKVEEESKLSESFISYDLDCDENSYFQSEFNDSEQLDKEHISSTENIKNQSCSHENECKQEIHTVPQTKTYVTIQDGLEIKNIILRNEFIRLEFESTNEIITDNPYDILKILDIRSTQVAKVHPIMSSLNKLKYIITFFEIETAFFYLKELKSSSKGIVKPFFEKNILNEKFQETFLEIRISTIETQEKIYKLTYENIEDLLNAAQILHIYGDSFGLYVNEEAMDFGFNTLTIQFLDSDNIEKVLEILAENGRFPSSFEKSNIEITFSEEELSKETRKILQDINLLDSTISIQKANQLDSKINKILSGWIRILHISIY